jgi:4-amino-4-deoxy-L-arabinose transferase-like glycosyltransferase
MGPSIAMSRDVTQAAAAARDDAPPARSVVWLAAALACGVFVLFFRLGTYGLWDPDEGRHSEIAREMFAGTGLHRWLLLTFNGAPYHDKPILYYWLTALAYALNGVNALSARLVPAFAATAVLVLSLWWARRQWGMATAIAATLVLASTIEFVVLGRYGDLNMLLALWITAGILAAYTWVERGGRGWGLIVAAVAAGGGTLGKGFVAPVLIGMTMLVYLVVRRRLSVLKLAPLARAALAYVVVTAPWYVAAGVADPAYMHDFIVEHHLQRFVGATSHLHPKPFVFTPLITLVAFFPWSPLLPAMARRAFARRGRAAATDLCLCWAACVVGFFTFSSGKLGTYVLPAMPPLALLAGRFLVSLPATSSAMPERRWVDGGFLAIGAVFVAMVPALLWVARFERGGALAGASWGALALLPVGAAILWLARAGRPRRAALAVALGTMAVVMFFYGAIAPRVSEVVGDVVIARAIRAADPEGRVPVIAYRSQNTSLLFHLERLVPRVDGKRHLRKRLAAVPKTFIVTRPDHIRDLSERLTLLAGGAASAHAVYVYEGPG